MDKSPTKEQVSRRAFLKSTSSTLIAGAMLGDLRVTGSTAGIDGSLTAQAQPETKLINSRRLLTGWDYRRGSLGGVWEVWRKANDDANTWQAVELPHCFN